MVGGSHPVTDNNNDDEPEIQVVCVKNTNPVTDNRKASDGDSSDNDSDSSDDNDDSSGNLKVRVRVDPPDSSDDDDDSSDDDDDSSEDLNDPSDDDDNEGEISAAKKTKKVKKTRVITEEQAKQAAAALRATSCPIGGSDLALTGAQFRAAKQKVRDGWIAKGDKDIDGRITRACHTRGKWMREQVSTLMTQCGKESSEYATGANGLKNIERAADNIILYAEDIKKTCTYYKEHKKWYPILEQRDSDAAYKNPENLAKTLKAQRAFFDRHCTDEMLEDEKDPECYGKGFYRKWWDKREFQELPVPDDAGIKGLKPISKEQFLKADKPFAKLRRIIYGNEAAAKKAQPKVFTPKKRKNSDSPASAKASKKAKKSPAKGKKTTPKTRIIKACDRLAKGKPPASK